MAPPGALHSDHINYLIYRYLQENGHESTAIAFHQDWHRPREYHDPETLPFARVVKRHALVSVVQDGLLYDELSASHSLYGRKFGWTAVNAREPLEGQDLGVLENGNGANGSGRVGAAEGGRVESRNGKRAAVKERRSANAPTQQPMRAPDEFPTPGAKRQRRSEGSEALVHLNGDRVDRDAMDVDAPALSPSAEADEDADAAGSPTNAASDAEVIDVPERYDSMDVATQTDVKTGTKTSTMAWNIDETDTPGARILHSIWNPDSDSKNAHTLLTVGESLCRFYNIPEDIDSISQITHSDDANIPPNSAVTATAWHPAGHSAAYAVDSSRELADGTAESDQLILSHHREHGTSVLEAGEPGMLDPTPIVLCLRYSPSGHHILVLRTNLKRGLLQVWRTPPTPSQKAGDDNEDPDPQNWSNEPIAWCLLQYPAYDACWLSETQLALCGDERLPILYTIDSSLASTGQMHNMKASVDENLTGLGTAKWDKVRFDPASGHIVFVSLEARMLHAARVVDMQTPGKDVRLWPAGPDSTIDLPGTLTALAFMPPAPQQQRSAGKDSASGLLAAAFEEGFCAVYRVEESFRPSGVNFASGFAECKDIVRIELPEGGPALALAWSPEGKFLAVGGAEVVGVWAAEELRATRAGGQEEKKLAPVVVWRADSRSALGGRNGEIGRVEEGEEVVQPCLSWSADGERLCFAVDRQLSVIKFRPPLHGEGAAAQDADADADADGDADADADGSVE